MRAKHCGELLLNTTKSGDWYSLNLLLWKRGLLKRGTDVWVAIDIRVAVG